MTSTTKISIITAAPHVRNYGSVLMTYATKKLFERYGFNVEFVDYTRHTIEEAESFGELADAIETRRIFSKLPRFLRVGVALLLYPSIKHQIRAFRPFWKQHITITSYKYDNDDALLLNPPQADVYCTGGDQMWNEQHNGHKTIGAFYLSYAPQNKLCVSFSTSIGKEHFDDWEIPEVLPLLSKYQYISVRESSAKLALENIGLNNVTQIIDPTLLIEPNVWEDISSPRLINDEYILIYEMSRKSSITPAALKLKHYSKRKLVRINSYAPDALKCGESILYPTPEEFLSLFRYASCIVTNSFHGAAFSIAFMRPFIVIPGANPTRLRNMLCHLGLEQRICDDASSIISRSQKSIDYDYVYARLVEERERCSAFINRIRNSVMASSESYRVGKKS